MPSKANRMNWSPPQELAVSNAYEIAALVAVLERKGLVTHRKVLETIKRQRRNCGMRHPRLGHHTLSTVPGGGVLSCQP